MDIFRRQSESFPVIEFRRLILLGRKRRIGKRFRILGVYCRIAVCNVCKNGVKTFRRLHRRMIEADCQQRLQFILSAVKTIFCADLYPTQRRSIHSLFEQQRSLGKARLQPFRRAVFIEYGQNRFDFTVFFFVVYAGENFALAAHTIGNFKQRKLRGIAVSVCFLQFFGIMPGESKRSLLYRFIDDSMELFDVFFVRFFKREIYVEEIFRRLLIAVDKSKTEVIKLPAQFSHGRAVIIADKGHDGFRLVHIAAVKPV